MQQHVYAISETCEQLGVRHAIICPGSRSAPLVFGFTKSKKISCYSIVDERSAAFVALGIARETSQPVVLICTSGSASLNFFPAVAEAFYQKIPLLLLTADRPPELLNQQDGQMIMQKGVFGKHVLSSYELPCFAHGKENMGATSAMVSKAIATALGPVPGPVHINVPLREPLYPTGNQRLHGARRVVSVAPRTDATYSASHITTLASAWKHSEKILVLVGQNQPDNTLFTALTRLAKKGAVILGDVLSNQQAVCSAPAFDSIISGSSQATNDSLRPDMIISFGGPVLSKGLKNWLKTQRPPHHFRLQPGSEQVNTYGNVTRFLSCHPPATLLALTEETSLPSHSAYFALWERAQKKATAAISAFISNEQPSELHFTHAVLQKVPAGADLHIGNSSVIRYVSMLGLANAGWVMHGNRGVSGLEGCSSTAVGAALVNKRLTVLLTGDLGFLYDRNAFLNDLLPANLRVIVLNNGGGGIFRLIDGPSSNANELRWFTTPHSHPLKNTISGTGLNYYFCDSLSNLEPMLSRFFIPSAKASVLEIACDMKKNAEVFRSFHRGFANI